MATHGKGASFGIGDGGDPETFADIGEVTGLELPDWSRELIETTHHGSTAKEWIAQPLVDYGEASVTVNRNPGDAADAALEAAFASPDPANFRIEIPAPGGAVETWILPAVPTNLSRASPLEAQQSATLTLKVVGAPSLSIA